MPDDLRIHINSLPKSERRQVWISCQEITNGNATSVNIKYAGTRGFPGYYYPYQFHDGYLSPIVPVQVVVNSK